MLYLRNQFIYKGFFASLLITYIFNIYNNFYKIKKETLSFKNDFSLQIQLLKALLLFFINFMLYATVLSNFFLKNKSFFKLLIVHK